MLVDYFLRRQHFHIANMVPVDKYPAGTVVKVQYLKPFTRHHQESVQPFEATQIGKSIVYQGYVEAASWLYGFIYKNITQKMLRNKKL